MNPERQQAIDYLSAPANGLWRWADDGAVVVWRDGSTVAFREEIRQILEWLAPNGLPSFGAIVFLLAACRGKVPAVEDIVTESKATLPTGMGKDAAVLLTARKQLRAQLEDALNQLKRVSRLPGELNSGIKAKCVLCESVFEPAKAERHVQAVPVLLGMQSPLGDADLVDPQSSSGTGNYLRQIHIVAEGLRPHTAESLALRLRTGLDGLPGETDVNLPTAERAQKLIEELSRDRDVGIVARAARELMAAMRLPRRLGERDQLALGGVADITNRGPLDRLLLSELAHDDLTLAVRVALNEALYLRREPPMREPPGTLALLLDSGVRLWGIPRVLATSVALAMIACDKQHSAVQAWRAHGKELRSVELLTRNGLIQHLATLEVEAHPGEAVPAFAEAVSTDAQNQSVLITHRDALDDAEFRRSLAALSEQPGFIATVDRAGRFELHALPLAHRTPLCEADLDLDAVFKEEQGVSLRREDVDPALPAIFGMPAFPFLLPVTGKLDHWVKAGDGFTYAVFNDRRLVKFKDNHSGARILAADLPAGKTLWMDCVDGVVHLVKAGASQRPTRLVRVTTDGSVRVSDLLSGEVLAVHRYGDVILVIRHADVRACALSDGRMLSRKLNPHRWANGRFFREGHKFYFASWDGTEVQFELVTMPKAFDASVIELVFDREGLEGPWFVQRGGVLISSATDQQDKLPMPPQRPYGFDSIRVSRDGHRILWVVEAEKWGRLKDLESGKVSSFLPQHAKYHQVDVQPPLPNWNLYRVVESVAIIPDGLAICGRKGRWRKLALNARGKLRIGELPERGHELAGKRAFAKQVTPPRSGCTLEVAELPNGAKVFLDSRGLLHFKSKDTDLPEASLVLAETEIAGWTSDGFVCGPAFFFEGAHMSETAKVYERLQRILSS